MDPEGSRYDVFISYSHEDAKKYGENAIQLIKDMIEADLHDSVCRPLVFLDSEALKFGDEWHAKIMDKLNECRVFVCLLSENYLKSSYCTRERLWWERKEICQGRLRQDTLPVYFISLNNDPFKDTRRQVRDLSGFQMNAKPWFEEGANEVKKAYLEERIAELKRAVNDRLSRAAAAAGFNTVYPEPSKSFVGRIVELRELREICLHQQYPIIEGGAGVGKSELATVYAYGYADEYPQGRFLIHMEGKKNWEEAVVSLVKDPDTGKRVQKVLGIKDEEMNKSDSELHGLIIEKLFAHAEQGRLLLLLDNVDDASLFEEGQLQDFSRNCPIPRAPDGKENIHMIATTRHQLDLSNDKCHARSFPIGNLDDDASFELFCEIGQNRFPFCTKPILDKDSDPEYKAVMEIIHLLEGHVWSMEIIAGQIAFNYKNSVTFRKKLSSLKEKFIIKDENRFGKPRRRWRSAAEKPEDLVQGTLDILKKCENGDAIIQLAYFAAMLSPDGRKQEVLRACWEKLFSDIEFEDDPDDVFCYAYNHLWRYNLIHSENDDKMHRLTQAALKQIMKKDGIFDDFVGKLADVMAGAQTFSFETWIDTVSVTPEIAAYFNQTRPEFLSLLFSPKAWVQLLSCDPPSPVLVDLCPWDKLDGFLWSDLLSIQPQFTDKCDWGKLGGSAWKSLLSKQPQFADRCDWAKLNGYEWGCLLSEQPQPQFADKCPWDKLGGEDWSWLLREQPQFADKCPWDKLGGGDWSWLLQEQPQFADRCDWGKLDGGEWARLLAIQPQFADRCDWDKLNGYEWGRLLQEQPQPQFADKCPWDKLDGENWQSLLSEQPQPQFADKCDWDKLDGEKWSYLLSEQPQFANRCEWDKLNGINWAELLSVQPQFADKCDWGKLNDAAWVFILLLEAQPQFADRCPWDKLDGFVWAELLSVQPQFADKCPWDILDPQPVTVMPKPKGRRPIVQHGHWERLLSQQPQFADQCDWNKLTGRHWVLLLRKQSQFGDRCPWDKLDGRDWSILLQDQPQFALKCPWDKLGKAEWLLLLKKQPQFAEKAALFRKG